MVELITRGLQAFDHGPSGRRRKSSNDKSQRLATTMHIDRVDSQPVRRERPPLHVSNEIQVFGFHQSGAAVARHVRLLVIGGACVRQTRTPAGSRAGKFLPRHDDRDGAIHSMLPVRLDEANRGKSVRLAGGRRQVDGSKPRSSK
jgi:hypothetical protein